MRQDPTQPAFVPVSKACPIFFSYTIKGARMLFLFLFFVLRAQKFCAHHWSERQRNECRYSDGYAHGDRELTKQSADDTSHEQKRNENGNQRDTERNHREADLLCTF